MSNITIKENNLPKPKNNLVSLDQQLNYATTLIKSKLLPSTYNTPEKVILALDMARSLNITLTDALFNIDFIPSKTEPQGIPAPRAKLLTRLILRSGGIIRKVKDYEPVYGTIFDEKGEIKYTAKENTENKIRPTDYVTTIKGGRIFNGQTIWEEASFKWSEAHQRGLLVKDNWKKMPVDMMWSKALSRLARRFFADYISGFYDKLDLKDSMNIPLNDDDIHDLEELQEDILPDEV